MNEKELKYLEIKSQNLMNLRTAYFAIMIALTGGNISLFYNLSILNVILLIVGIITDYFFFTQIIVITKQMNSILKILRG